MMAITLWQPWATLVMVGAKSHEFRTWTLGSAYRGRSVVMHAAARKIDQADIARVRVEIARGFSPSLGRADLKMASALLDRYAYDNSVLPRGVALGTVIFGDPVRAVDEFAAEALAAGFDPADLNPDIWGWPVLERTTWPEPIPASGSQGLWRWRGPVPEAA